MDNSGMKLGFCEVCNQPLALIDVDETGVKSGLGIPKRSYGYVIVCRNCEAQCRYEDEGMRRAIIDAILMREATDDTSSS